MRDPNRLDDFYDRLKEEDEMIKLIEEWRK